MLINIIANHIRNFRRLSDSEKLLLVISIILIGIGITARLKGFLVNRSLWLDESFLGSSVINRNYCGLLQPLDYIQGAPILYLWMVKTLTIFFGHSEYVLRLPSLVAGIGSIFLFYKLLKNVLGDPRAYIGTAFFATIPFLIYYSYEFKPYMCDGFFTLLSVCLFHKFLKDHKNTILLGIYSALLVWISFPSIFYLTAFYLIFFIGSIFQKNRKNIITSAALGGVTALSFILYYLFFYQNLSASLGLLSWEKMKFPIFLKNKEDISVLKQITIHYLSIFGLQTRWIILFLTTAGLILMYKFHHKSIFLFTTLTAFLLIIASWLGYYGMLNRILIFIIPVHVSIISVPVNIVSSRYSFTGLLIALLLLSLNLKSVQYLHENKIYRSNREVKSTISYYNKNLSNNPLYLYRANIPTYEYYAGYPVGFKTTPKSPVKIGSVVYGSTFYRYCFKKPYSWESVIENDKLQANIQSIIKHNAVCLLLGQCPETHKKALFESLEQHGSLKEVYSFYDTKIYLFEKQVHHNESVH